MLFVVVVYVVGGSLFWGGLGGVLCGGLVRGGCCFCIGGVCLWGLVFCLGGVWVWWGVGSVWCMVGLLLVGCCVGVGGGVGGVGGGVGCFFVGGVGVGGGWFWCELWKFGGLVCFDLVGDGGGCFVWLGLFGGVCVVLVGLWVGGCGGVCV
uniref:NADH dehydrogenase subunit 6 n=1 Tax=Knipowitschia caucasica TaxID=637954 RepID=A0AAV2LH58_KNICA